MKPEEECLRDDCLDDDVLLVAPPPPPPLPVDEIETDEGWWANEW